MLPDARAKPSPSPQDDRQRQCDVAPLEAFLVPSQVMGDFGHAPLTARGVYEVCNNSPEVVRPRVPSVRRGRLGLRLLHRAGSRCGRPGGRPLPSALHAQLDPLAPRGVPLQALSLPSRVDLLAAFHVAALDAASPRDIVRHSGVIGRLQFARTHPLEVGVNPTPRPATLWARPSVVALFGFLERGNVRHAAPTRTGG